MGVNETSMRGILFLLRLIMSVIILVIIDTQIRYIFDLIDLFNLVQSGFTKRWESHVKNTFSQAIQMFFLMGWLYAILILLYGVVSKTFNIKNLWIKLVLSTLLLVITYLVYWYLAQHGDTNELFYGLSVYFILGLITPVVLNYTMRGKLSRFEFGIFEERSE